MLKWDFRITLFLFISVVSTSPWAEPNDPELRARALLSQSIAAMGGLDLLRGVDSLSYESVQHTFFHRVEISESSPQIIVYENNAALLQPKRHNLRESSHWRWTDSTTQTNSLLTITPQGGFTETDDKKGPITADRFYKAIDILAANPISAVLFAHEAAVLKLETPSRESEVVSYNQTIFGQPVKLALGISKETRLLQWIEIEHSYSQDVFASFWGRTVRRVVLAGWSLDPSGLYFPTKWQISTNGRIDGQESLFNLKINPGVTASDFSIPEEFKKPFDFLQMTDEALALRNHGDSTHLDIREGIVMLPGKSGAYNSLIVKQDRGLVVIEAPYSNANSEYVIAYARHAFPGTPIAGVISTNQLQFHLAGLSAYAKVHAAIYVLDSNVALMKRFLAAQVSAGRVRDSDIKLRTVKSRAAIGGGENRAILIPFRGTASARMMAVYFPTAKLLYCSDLYLPQQWGGQHLTEHLSEIRDLIDREHIEVRQVAGVSMVPHDWNDLSASIPAKQSRSEP